MPNQKRNEYRCAIEINQAGKYCVRLRVDYARRPWKLAAYFLASSFDRAIKKLRETVNFLQRGEERLWFWTVEMSDDPNLADEMLVENGLRLDRRTDFPRRSAVIEVPVEKSITSSLLGEIQKKLAVELEEMEERAVVAR
jgi:hypothetical protein